MKEEKDFKHLGLPYQKRLIAQFITDYKFSNNIMDIVDPNYFSDEYLRKIVATIKDAYDNNEVIPDIESLGFRLAERKDNAMTKKFINAQLAQIKDISLNDSEEVQDMAMRFCQQQELKKVMGQMQVIFDKGDPNSYEQCEVLLKKALEVGNNKDDAIDVFYNLEAVLSDDFRSPIPTGIIGLDAKMNGGLSKGELAVVLAPFGVGKTTFMTKLASTAFDNGLNVLQIFFEDTPKIIQRKHLACWTEIPINDLGLVENRPVLDTIMAEKESGNGYLKLKKFPSDGTTMPMIKQYVRKLAAAGQKPDIILLDYIDCVTPVRGNGDSSEWSSEGVIMRQFETLLTEYDMAGWTAIQGNRSSISAETVDSSMLGGSIKKGQIAHFLLSIAKSLEQKETGRANMAILKSRFGIDGIVFDDILFDNARIQIEVEDGVSKTTLEKENSKGADSIKRVKELMSKIKQDRENDVNNNNNNNEV